MRQETWIKEENVRKKNMAKLFFIFWEGNLFRTIFSFKDCYEIKNSVGWIIDTFGSNNKFHTVMKVLNYRFIKWTDLGLLLTHWV